MFIDLRGLETVAFPAGLAWFEIDVVLAERWEHDFRFSEKQLRLRASDQPVSAGVRSADHQFPADRIPAAPDARAGRPPKFTPSIP